MASIWLVSSIDTLSTKSKVSPTGNSSRIAAARSRISGSMAARPEEEKVGVTTRRCASWSGGSSAMKLDPSLGSKASAIMMPPSLESEEKTSWLESTATMSWNRVTDQ